MNWQKTLAAAAITTVALAGCGGGGGGSDVAEGGISGTGLIYGPITAFGSIWVNGIRFDTADSEILVNGEMSDDSALGLGMMVSVSGTVNQDGVSGKAETVEFSGEVEGPVDSIEVSPDGSGSMVVLGQVILFNSDTVFEGGDRGIEPGDILVGALVEVSGLTDGNGVIVATRVEVESADWAGEEVKVKGVIQDLAPTTFRIGELVVDWSQTALLPDDPLANGLYVEIESDRGFDDAGRLLADRIELEGDGSLEVGDDGEDVNILGVVTEPLSGGVFFLNGQAVRITSATEFDDGSIDDLVLNALVKVEGMRTDEEILAEEIEFKDSFDDDSGDDSDDDSGDDSDDDSGDDSGDDSDDDSGDDSGSSTF